MSKIYSKRIKQIRLLYQIDAHDCDRNAALVPFMGIQPLAIGTIGNEQIRFL